MQPQWLWSNSNAIFHGLGSPSPSFWKKSPRNSHPVQSCIWFGDALWSRDDDRVGERGAQQSTRSDLDGRSTTNPSGLWLSATYLELGALTWLPPQECTEVITARQELRSALIYYYCYRTFLLLLLRLVVKQKTTSDQEQQLTSQFTTIPLCGVDFLEDLFYSTNMTLLQCMPLNLYFF